MIEGTCSMCGGKTRYTTWFCWETRRKGLLEDIDADGWIMWKCIWRIRMYMNWIYLSIRPVGGKFWTWKLTFLLYKRREISWVSKQLPASREEHCFTELIKAETASSNITRFSPRFILLLFSSLRLSLQKFWIKKNLSISFTPPRLPQGSPCRLIQKKINLIMRLIHTPTMNVFVLLHVKYPQAPTAVLLDSHYEKCNITYATAASSVLVHWQRKRPSCV
jgi:hypothetical protein